MVRSAVFVACVGLLCLGVASRAQAESFDVILTGGFLNFDLHDPSSGVSVFLDAAPRFTTPSFGLAGLADPNQTFNEPLQGCLVCAPGETIGTAINIAGWINGGAGVDGQSYTFGPDANAIINVGGGNITVPAFRPSPVVVTQRVDVNDSAFAFFGNTDPDLNVFANINGTGRVLVTFAPVSTGEHLWDVRDIRYEFGVTPTPEPATLLLVGGGLLVTARRVRKRRL